MYTGFSEIKSTLRLPVPVKLCNNIKAGIEHVLADMIMKYDQGISGVLIAYWNIKLTHEHAQILDTDPAYIIVDCTVTMLVFKFDVKHKLIGRVNVVGKDHIGLVVLDAFNVAIKQKDIGSRYVYSGLLNAWKTKDTPEAGAKKRKMNDNRDIIKEGAFVAFEVESINDEDGYFSVNGSLLSSGTGLVQDGNKGPVATEAAALLANSPAQGASPAKKKRDTAN
jgi:hypothetical protein